MSERIQLRSYEGDSCPTELYLGNDGSISLETDEETFPLSKEETEHLGEILASTRGTPADPLTLAAMAFVAAHEKWEANLIINGDWSNADGLPTIRFGYDAYDGAMKLQEMRNELKERLQARLTS